MFHDAPPEQHAAKFFGGGLTLGDDLEIRRSGGFYISLLEEIRFGTDAAEITARGFRGVFEEAQETQILFLLEESERIRCEIRSDNHFAEDLGDGFGTREIERAIDGNDAAERSLLVSGVSLIPRFAERFALADAAGIGVL